jgi:hypothetical protein
VRVARMDGSVFMMSSAKMSYHGDDGWPWVNVTRCSAAGR